MHDFIQFVLRHWELWLAFVVLSGYWLGFEFQQRHGGNAVSAQQVVHLMNRQHAIVVDIREEAQFQQGHILGALSMPEKTLFEQPGKLKKYQQKPVILIDANGQTAKKVLDKLIREKFTQVVYLKDGIQAWQAAKLPIQKG